MRHSTWLKLEASPVWHSAYRMYRKLPARWRAPLRWLLLPHWTFLAALIDASARQQVVAGPFAGTKLLLSEQSARLLPCYILGTAELEIHRAIEKLVAQDYRTILNIGAADGYYAVGLARRLPAARVVAFEAIGAFHEVIESTAAVNRVADRVQVKGHCDRDVLREALASAKPPILVIADLEGYEAQLLDPSALPALQTVDLLIETHDAVVPSCTQMMVSRFRSTHRVERFVARPRELRDFPAGFLPLLPRLFPGAALELMNERRTGPQEWLCCHAQSFDRASMAYEEARQNAPTAPRPKVAAAEMS
jgi:hypothetical protein